MSHRFITAEQFNTLNAKLLDIASEVYALGLDVEKMRIHPDHSESLFTTARILRNVRYALAEEATGA